MWIQDALEGLANKIYGIENHTPVLFTGTKNTDSGYCYGSYDPLTGLVTLDFCWLDDTSISTSTKLFTVPEDYRPSSAQSGAGVCGSTSINDYCRCSVNTSGEIKNLTHNSKMGFGSIKYYI